MERRGGMERGNMRHVEPGEKPEQREYAHREEVQIALIRRMRERIARENPGMTESDTYSEAMHAWLGKSPDDPNSLASRFDRQYEEMKAAGIQLPNLGDSAALEALLARLSIT